MDLLKEKERTADTAAKHAPNTVAQFRSLLLERLNAWIEQLQQLTEKEKIPSSIWIRGIEQKIEEVHQIISQLEHAPVASWENMKHRIEKNSQYIEKHFHKVDSLLKKKTKS